MSSSLLDSLVLIDWSSCFSCGTFTKKPYEINSDKRILHFFTTEGDLSKTILFVTTFSILRNTKFFCLKDNIWSLDLDMVLSYLRIEVLLRELLFSSLAYINQYNLNSNLFFLIPNNNRVNDKDKKKKAKGFF